MKQQAMVLWMLQTRGRVKSREFIRELEGWDFRKCITRLRRRGYVIENISLAGQEGEYEYRGKGIASNQIYQT